MHTWVYGDDPLTDPDKLEPSEWKWVPKYPDDAMFNAGVVVCRKKTVGSIRRAQAVWDAMYLAAPTPPSPPAPAMGEWVHIKTGGSYTLIARGMLESNREPVVIYRGKDDRVWVRPEAEFMDGRFERIENPEK